MKSELKRLVVTCNSITLSIALILCVNIIESCCFVNITECSTDFSVCNIFHKLTNFMCKICQGLLDKNVDESITLYGDDIESLNKFSYFGDVLSTEGRAVP